MISHAISFGFLLLVVCRGSFEGSLQTHGGGRMQLRVMSKIMKQKCDKMVMKREK